MSVVNCRPRGGVCRLYLKEYFWLLKHFNDVSLLNKKSEFISKCKHKNKMLIKSARVVCFSFASFVTYLLVYFRNIIDA